MQHGKKTCFTPFRLMGLHAPQITLKWKIHVTSYYQLHQTPVMIEQKPNVQLVKWESKSMVELLTILRYADDTALIAENENDLQHMIDIVNDIGEDLNMRVNTKKTKYMVVGKDDEHKSKWRGTGTK
ncbi:hypothetical protein GQR58_011694 [Nymphon striatum]|nr:hypothetical protein GQR58_011694 [Nymphon striatum]